MSRSILALAYCLAQVVAMAQTDPAIHEQLVARSIELMNVMERQDRAALEAMVAEEFMLEVPGDTAAVPRAEWIDNAVNMKWDRAKFNNVKVRSFGDVAVVSSLLDYRVTTGIGIPISSSVQATDVWVHRNGQWLIAVRQLGEDAHFSKARMVMGFLAALVLWLLVFVYRRWRSKVKSARVVVSPA